MTTHKHKSIRKIARNNRNLNYQPESNAEDSNSTDSNSLVDLATNSLQYNANLPSTDMCAASQFQVNEWNAQNQLQYNYFQGNQDLYFQALQIVREHQKQNVNVNQICLSEYYQISSESVSEQSIVQQLTEEQKIDNFHDLVLEKMTHYDENDRQQIRYFFMLDQLDQKKQQQIEAQDFKLVKVPDCDQIQILEMNGRNQKVQIVQNKGQIKQKDLGVKFWKKNEKDKKITINNIRKPIQQKPTPVLLQNKLLTPFQPIKTAEYHNNVYMQNLSNALPRKKRVQPKQQKINIFQQIINTEEQYNESSFVTHAEDQYQMNSTVPQSKTINYKTTYISQVIGVKKYKADQETFRVLYAIQTHEGIVDRDKCSRKQQRDQKMFKLVQSQIYNDSQPFRQSSLQSELSNSQNLTSQSGSSVSQHSSKTDRQSQSHCLWLTSDHSLNSPSDQDSQV